MGRSRKPFLDKSTNIFLRFTNIEIVQLLNQFNIEHKVPDLVWDDETIEALKKAIKDDLLKK
ncbi:hypothetical protein [Peribacillus phoenicis]|uniref:hypothetical protein n=1 Tax=unclassified Peribacillus TaxID=2675266 RepID=UPI00399F55F5